MTVWTLANPWFLLLFLPAVAALLLALRRCPPAIRVSSIAPYRESSRGQRRFTAHVPLLLEFLAAVLLILALARPRKGVEEFIQRSEGVDIILCLDVSGSMRFYDIPNRGGSRQALRAIREGRLKNRVGIAKSELRRFIEERPGDRIGLIAFSKVPYVVCPPTLDHAFLIEHLDLLEAGMFGGSATGIAGPIASATQRLKDSEAAERVAVLFTDGANNVDSKISPRQAARIADGFDVRIHTVGIGSSQTFTTVQLALGGQSLRQVRSDLDEDLLKAIAEKSGGEYFAARDAGGFRQVMRTIDAMERVDFEAPRYIDYKEQFPPLLLAAAILLGTALILDNTLLCRAP